MNELTIESEKVSLRDGINIWNCEFIHNGLHYTCKSLGNYKTWIFDIRLTSETKWLFRVRLRENKKYDIGDSSTGATICYGDGWFDLNDVLRIMKLKAFL